MYEEMNGIMSEGKSKCKCNSLNENVLLQAITALVIIILSLLVTVISLVGQQRNINRKEQENNRFHVSNLFQGSARGLFTVQRISHNFNLKHKNSFFY